MLFGELRWPRCAVARAVIVGGLVTTAAGYARGETPAAHVRKGPYVTGLSARAADVRFELDRPATAAIELARDGALDTSTRRVASAAPADMHVIHVAGLEPDTRYAYLVRVGGETTARGHFVTAPAPDTTTPLTFQVYGDDRTDPAAHAAVVQALLQAPSVFVVNTGDLVAEGGRAEDWQTFFDIEAPLLAQRPIFAAVGNHELVDDAAGANFVRYFGVRDADGTPTLHASARVGIVRFFFLNAMDDWSSGPQRQWFERELAQADAEPGLVWRIVVLHHSPWSVGPHGPNTRLLDARVPELLAAHKVDLLFAGHDHIYDRGESGGIKYIVTGGGGAPLYAIERVDPTARKAESTYHFVSVDVTRTEIRVVATRVDGSVLDRCGFAKRASWDCDPPPVSSAAAAANPPVESAGRSERARCGCVVVGARAPAPAVSGIVVAGLAALRRRRRRPAIRT